MRRTVSRLGVVVIAVAANAFVLGPIGVAHADPGVAGCTSSYAPYTYDELAFDPAAQAIFPVIDKNGDGTICFKAYHSGPHKDHDGNLTDNNSATHE